jgi:hypothetical protein
MIAGLPASCHIYIYDLRGLLVAQLAEDDGDGGVLWNPGTTGNNPAPGVYVVLVKSGGIEVRKKLAVVGP